MSISKMKYTGKSFLLTAWVPSLLVIQLSSASWFLPLGRPGRGFSSPLGEVRKGLFMYFSKQFHFTFYIFPPDCFTEKCSLWVKKHASTFCLKTVARIKEFRTEKYLVGNTRVLSTFYNHLTHIHLTKTTHQGSLKGVKNRTTNRRYRTYFCSLKRLSNAIKGPLWCDQPIGLMPLKGLFNAGNPLFHPRKHIFAL